MDVSNMLNYIREYNIETSISVPRGTSVPRFNLTMLYNRLNEARNTFIMLIDKQLNVDAALLAGNILELCATIYYIKSSKDQELNTRKYVAKSCANTACDILVIDKSDLSDERYKGLFDDCVGYLADTGHLILRPKGVDKLKYNKGIVSKLRSTDRNNKDKRDIIKENYELPIVKNYLNCFIAGIQQQLQDNSAENTQNLGQVIQLFYTLYCSFKHAGPIIYHSEITDENITFKNIESAVSIPAVYLSLDMISDNPVYIK